MKKFKNVVAVMLCVAMMISAAACEKSGSRNSADGSNESTVKENQNPLAEHMEISWLAFWCAGLSPNNWAQKEIEKKFNVTFSIPDVDANADKQKVDLMIASGEMPDFAAFTMKSPVELYEQEVTRSIPVSTIKKFAPNYSKLMDSNPAGWKMYANKDKKDELMAMTGFSESQCSYPYFASFYRLDWLENLGIKPHGKLESLDKEGKMWVASEAFTRDEFVDIMDKFTNNDPDKNNKKDTIGTIGMNSLSHTWYPIMGSFGIADTYSMNENGKAIYYYSSSKYKEFLKFTADLYKKGYIDREFLTNDWAKMQEKYAKGNAGYVATCTSYMSANPALATRAPMVMLKNNPNAKIVMCPPEIGPNKEQGVPIYSPTPFNYKFYISKKVDNKKLERILQIFDYAAVSKEGYLKFRYGEEGTHYTVEEMDGYKYWKWKDNVKFGGESGLGVFCTNMVLPNDGRLMHDYPDTQKLVKNYLLTDNWLKYNIVPYKYDLAGSTNLSAVEAQSIGAIDTILKEFYSKAVTGEINPDTEWDAYIKKLSKAGYDKILEELNKAPLYKDVMSGKF